MKIKTKIQGGTVLVRDPDSPIPPGRGCG